MVGLPELDDNERIDTAYEGDIRVVEVEREDDINLYRFEAPGHKYKNYDLGPEFENPHAARLYAAVYVVCGFREEKTGRRGIPEAVVKAGREEVIAYQRCHPGKDADWLAHKHDIDRQRVYEYTSRVKSRAADKRDLITTPENE